MNTQKILYSAVIAALSITLVLSSGCSRSEVAEKAAPQQLMLYSGQHERLAKALAEGFERDTGISVQLRVGKDGELANQIIEEGVNARADVFITEEPGPIGDLGRRGLLTPIPRGIIERADARFAPSDSGWLPFAARSRVLFYNPTLIEKTDLPKSMLELSDAKWKGRFAYAPSGAFRSITGYLLKTQGEEATLAWLRAIKENGANEQKNGKVRDSVEAGQYAFGLSNHYYWYILARSSGGEDKLASRVHFMNVDDAGALMLASGAGVLRTSKNQATALKFVDWLISPEGGQKIVSESSPQFPLGKGTRSSYGLPAIEDLTFPEFDQGELNNVDDASRLLKQAGLI